MLAGLGLFGCTSIVPGGDDAFAQGGKVEAVVKARAQQRWKELLAGEFNKAYEFISPAGRLKLQVRDYRLRINTSHIKKAEVKEASCQAELCDVKVRLDYVLENVPINRVVSEVWILDEGKWWFVYRG
jgi:hypothetical protein